MDRDQLSRFIVADGRSGRNRNITTGDTTSLMIVADGRSGRNRNKSGD